MSRTHPRRLLRNSPRLIRLRSDLHGRHANWLKLQHRPVLPVKRQLDDPRLLLDVMVVQPQAQLAVLQAEQGQQVEVQSGPADQPHAVGHGERVRGRVQTGEPVGVFQSFRVFVAVELQEGAKHGPFDPIQGVAEGQQDEGAEPLWRKSTRD